MTPVDRSYIGSDGLSIEIGQEVYHTNCWERAIVVGYRDCMVELEGATFGRFEAFAEDLQHGIPDKMHEFYEEYPWNLTGHDTINKALFNRFCDGFRAGMAANGKESANESKN